MGLNMQNLASEMVILRGEELYTKEGIPAKAIILTVNGEPNNKLASELTRLKQGDKLENAVVMSSSDLPAFPPKGIEVVYEDSPVRFRDKDHEHNWKGIRFRRIVWNQDGTLNNIR